MAVLNAGAAIYAGGGAGSLARGRARRRARDRLGRGRPRRSSGSSRAPSAAGAHERARAGSSSSRRAREVGRAREALAERRARRGRGGERRARFRDALRCAGLSLIAEHKRRSPSAGPDPRRSSGLETWRRRLRARRRLGAVDPDRGVGFGGTLEDLAGARRAASLPILRKDFIVDEYQVAEAVVGGRGRDPPDRRRARTRRAASCYEPALDARARGARRGPRREPSSTARPHSAPA